jgi:NAD(P)-dependent dehydrogenase (short-subunit alcohol dehydrogenase family)
MSDQRVVLITGASSGVGQSMARLLAREKYKVFETSRNPAIAEAIPAVEMLPLDVRAGDSVRVCVEAVSSRAGHIDVLINNAGYELAGAVEELTSEEIRAQFETNFFGVVRMVKAVLPAMRRQRRGHIINVSSLAGVSSIPFLGMYCASKFALEGYTEALRHEVKPFNIRVSLTEAGFLKTPMMNNRQIERIGSPSMTRGDNGHSMPLVLMKRRGQARSWWPKRCSRSCPAMRRGYAIRLGSKRSPSPVYGAFSRHECSNRECGVPSHWIRPNENVPRA